MIPRVIPPTVPVARIVIGVLGDVQEIIAIIQTLVLPTIVIALRIVVPVVDLMTLYSWGVAPIIQPRAPPPTKARNMMSWLIPVLLVLPRPEEVIAIDRLVLVRTPNLSPLLR